MPYTLTHPGFILPLKKWKPQWFSNTGFVFGSFAPDFDILLRLTNSRFHLFQYTWKEILFLILPLAVISGLYYHLVIRRVMLRLLPTAVRSRFSDNEGATFKTRPAFRGLRLTYSALLAILLHILLDDMSHWDAFPFKVYGWIYFNNYWAGIIYYYLALYAPVILFSLTGALLTIYFLQLRRSDLSLIRPAILHRPLRVFLILFCIITGLAAAAKVLVSGLEAGYYIDHIVISLTNGMLVAFFVTPTLFYLRRRFIERKPV